MVSSLASPMHSQRPKSFYWLLSLSFVMVTTQLYGIFRLNRSYFHDAFDELLVDPSSFATSMNQTSFSPLKRLSKSESFGACLMLKEDNELLYEWLAYHYTTLPLRYVFVGSDVGNLHDPSTVLERWRLANTGLQYWIQNASAFIHRHGHEYGSVNSTEDAHHAFVHRQRAFITTCTEFMKSKGLQWVTYIDSDEFLVLNRLSKEESTATDPSTADNPTFALRKKLPSHDSNASILQTIQSLDPMHNFSHCYTMPRVLYGALENASCAGAPSKEELETQGVPYERLSTIRFHQHAQKGDFAMSKYGKVIMDVSTLPDSTITTIPRNIHRPYKPECGNGFALFPNSLFYLNHYLGSWERYSSREDGRRNKEEWEKRAHISTASSCNDEVFRWFERFLDIVGIERASFLLGDDFKAI